MLKKFLIFAALSISALSNGSENIEVGYANLDNHSFIQNENDNVNFEVIYFFNYGCKYCNAFEQYLDVYLKRAENINFIYKPINIQDSWKEYAKAYYIAENLDLKKDFHKKMFNDIHSKNKKILTKKSLENYFSKEYDVNYSDFRGAYNSYSVTRKLNQNEELADKFNITGTPTVIIISKNGKTYKVSPKISGGVFNMIATLVLLTN